MNRTSMSSQPGPSRVFSSLHCDERLADSPSTSCDVVLEPRPAFRQLQQPNRLFRRSIPTVDRLLNRQQRTSVYNNIDPNIQLDGRSLLSLFQNEETYQSNYHYFTAVQEHVTPFHREQAVEWIYDVAKEERCDGDVLPQAVAIIDRFLSSQNIYKHDIQMVAGVALFIASKLKAPAPLNAAKIAYYSDESLRVEDILSWELMMVSQLDWETESPTACDFFDQLVARMPALVELKTSFLDVLHRIQKMHKLATLFPSMQCAIALLFSADNRAPNDKYGAAVRKVIGEVFQLQVCLLESFYPLVEKCLIPGQPIYSKPEPSGVPTLSLGQSSPLAPPSSSEQLSPDSLAQVPMVQQIPISEMTPSTPLNDSGFSSDVSSPESAAKKGRASRQRCRRPSSFLDDDVTPPKIFKFN